MAENTDNGGKKFTGWKERGERVNVVKSQSALLESQQIFKAKRHAATAAEYVDKKLKHKMEQLMDKLCETEPVLEKLLAVQMEVKVLREFEKSVKNDAIFFEQLERRKDNE